MFAIRSASSARVAVRAPLAMSARFYSPGSSDGATATSKGFSQREQAEEGQYIKRQEAERLKKLKESIAKDQAEVDKIEKGQAANKGQ